MAQPPPDQNFYHHPHSHPHAHPQLQLPPQFRNPFDLLFDERTGAINYNYIRPYIPNQIPKPDLSDSLVMRRPRRTRTTFTSTQIAELEQHFLEGRYLTTSRLAELSAKLALGTAQVKIWFKNRRRRHKIQSDQQNISSYSCDGMPLSPSVASAKSESQGSSNSSGPPNIQTLSLGGSSGVSTPNTLTPSPTPTTPTANHMDHYGDSFNPYYYNNHHAAPPSHHGHPHPHTHHQYPPSTAAAAAAQFFTPPPGTLSHHQHQQQHQAQYHAHYQYEYQHKAQTVVSIKEEPDFNYNNNPYYMRMSSAAAAAAASAANAASASSVADGPTAAMSPHSEVYEPLTPKNDESPPLCNGGVDAADDIDAPNTKSIQVLGSNTNGGDDGCSNGGVVGNSGNINIMDDCNGAFAKYNKMSSDAHENNYQCTMDTIMQAYNHRNTSSNTQFAYCFN